MMGSMIQHVKRLKELGMDSYHADEIAHTIEDSLADRVSKSDLDLAVAKLQTAISDSAHGSTRWIVGSVFVAVLLQCVNSWIMFSLKH
jgi:Cdc6-like AAA superfamily ATPase